MLSGVNQDKRNLQLLQAKNKTRHFNDFRSRSQDDGYFHGTQGKKGLFKDIWKIKIINDQKGKMSMISIVVPCYNEEENIQIYEKELFPVLNKLGEKYEVIIVDDGSKDNTVQEIKKLQKKKKNVQNITYQPNQGLGYAVRQGIHVAKGDKTVILDADLTFHPRQIQLLVDKYNEGGYSCVIGSHFSKEGKLEEVQLYRKILSKGVNIIYCVLMGKNIKAISSIFRLYNTKDLKELHLTANKFEINVEILYKLLARKKKVVEVPVTMTKRRFGVSKLNNIREIKNHLKLMSKIMFWKVTRKFSN